MTDATPPEPHQDANAAATAVPPPQAPAAAPEPAQAATGAVARVVPADEAKRARDREGAKKRRLAKKLEREKAAAKLEGKLAGSTSTTGGASGGVASPSSSASGQVVAGEVLAPGQKAGWPTPTAIAEAEPLAAHLWGELNRQLTGTRYELRAESYEGVGDDGKPFAVQVHPVAQLAKGTAPLLAQLTGKMAAMTPATAALASVAMVFGPKVVGHVRELVMGMFRSDAPAQVGTSAPA